MNKDELAGKMENAKGRAKEAAGAVTGDKKMQGEGLAERVSGAAREKIGQVKERIAQHKADRERDAGRREAGEDPATTRKSSSSSDDEDVE